MITDVARVLTHVEVTGDSLRLALEKKVRGGVKRAVKAVASSVVQNYRFIDAVMAELLGEDFYYSLKPYERNLLRVIVHELRNGRTNLGTALRLVARLGKLSRRVNRRVLAEAMTVSREAVLSSFSGLERVAVEYSYPTWVAEYLVRLLGFPEALTLLRVMNRQATVWLRVNTMAIDRQSLVKKLRRRGVVVEEDDDLGDAVKVLKTPVSPIFLPEYRKGFFYIQDKASMLASHVLDPRPGETVLDACAAPGSKTTHMFQLVSGRGWLIAVDLALTRLKAVPSSAARLGFEGIDLLVGDSTTALFRPRFDRVLVDPNCSSLGRMGKNPEVRLWATPQRVSELACLQYRLLATAVRLVKRGGVIVYSTCTMTLEENEEVVKRVLDMGGVELVEASPHVGVRGLQGLEEAQRLYPHMHDTLGFFIAKLVKI